MWRKLMSLLAQPRLRVSAEYHEVITFNGKPVYGEAAAKIKADMRRDFSEMEKLFADMRTEMRGK